MSNRYPQRAQRVERQGSQLPRPRPKAANDNLPKRFTAANDNWAKPLKPFTSPVVSPKWVAPRILPRVLARLVPLAGLALTAYDLYELYQWYMQQGAQPNYAASGYCVLEPDFYNPQYPTDRWTWRYQSSCGPNPGPGGGASIGSIPAKPDDYNYLFLLHLAFQSTQEIQDHRWWYYPEPFNGVDPTTVGEPVPTGLPLEVPPAIIPWIDPMRLPVFAPQPLPVAPPVRRPRLPDGRPETSTRGNREPGFRPIPRPNGRPLPARATAGTKERKVKIAGGSAVRRWLGWLLSQASEAGDLLDALHEALPKQYRSDGNNRDKLLALYRNSDKINVADAITNIVNNQVEDRYMAPVFEQMQDVFESYGVDLISLRL